jgi:sterol desaturase/sphingolipid hydroxylase (fatty acid hydroxylase superfamily)
MSRYLKNRWIRIAIGLFLLGSVPLALLALLAIAVPPMTMAFPIGEVLWLVTFWPAVFLLAAGIVQVRGEK